MSAREAWKHNLPVLVGTQFLAVAAMSAVLPFIPFFVRELGVTDRAAVERWSGLIFSGPFLAAGIMSPVWGALGDRYGHKNMVSRAIIGLAVVNLGAAFVQTPLQFWVLRLFQGMITGFIPAALAITSASTPPEKLPDAMGRLSASASAGRLIGPAIGGLLAGVLPFRWIFVSVGSTIALATIAVIAFLQDPPRAAATQRASAAGNFRFAMGDWRMRAALGGLLVSMAGVSMVMPVFPLYVEDLLDEGADPAVWTGIGFAVVAGFTLLTATFIGRLSARFGLKNLLLGGLGVTAVALVAHPFAHHVPGMLFSRALMGVGVAAVQPVLYAMISRRAPQGRGGGIAGFAASASIFGFFVGPSLGGWLANGVGVRGVFWIAASILLVCALGVAAIARREGRSRVIEPVPDQLPR
ncbi:MAG: MFS transporter [Gemmatimonadetes bacterium]|nr:MFS transporter [Gemmatimonadota bacterium]